MASYTIRSIDQRFWRDLKVECARRGVSIRKLILDRLGLWVKDSQKLSKKEKRAGMVG